MTNDNTYQIYSNAETRNVPEQHIKYLIGMFVSKASINMGNDFTDKTLEGITDIIRNYFSYIPVCYVASAFIKGSLGYYGSGRLVPRTVYGWLSEITMEFNRDQANKKLQNSDSGNDTALDLHKYPIGQAIQQKLKWYKDGLLPGETWDRVDLHKLTDAIAKHEHLYVEDFIGDEVR